MKKLFWIFLIYLFPHILFAQSSQNTILAKKYYQKALKLYEEAAFDKSVEQFQKAEKLYREDKNWSQCLQCQNKIAESFIRQGKLEDALQLVQNTFQKELAKITEKKQEEAFLYTTLGEIYLNKGRNDLALENLQKANALYEKANITSSSEADCWNKLGLVYWNTGNKDLALEYQIKALNARKEMYGPMHPSVAASYNDIGLIYTSDAPFKALEYYQKALEIYSKIYQQDHPKIANSFNNIAIVYWHQRKYDLALENFDKTLEIREKVYGLTHPNIAFVYRNIAEVYSDKGEYFTALGYARQALEVYQKNYGEKHPEIAYTYNVIGTIYSRNKEYKNSLKNYQEAICANISNYQNKDFLQNPSIETYYHADLLLTSLHLKAQTLEELYRQKTLKYKHLTTSLATLELCDALLGKIRKLRTNKNDKIALGIVASEVYEDAIRTSLKLAEVSFNKRHYEEKAFYFAEKSKAAVLLSAISDTNAKEFANIPPQWIEEEKQLKSDIAFYEQKLADKPKESEEKHYRDTLFLLNRNYDGFVRKLEQKFPEYYNLKYNIQMATVAQIQKNLTHKTVVLSYFIAEKTNRIYLFQITKNKFFIENIKQDEMFEKYLIGLRNGIRFKSKKVFVRSATALYTQLFPRSFSSSITELLIIPDGKLGVIPFEALLTEKPDKKKQGYTGLPFLIKKYAITYNYASTLWLQTLQKKQPENTQGIFLCAPVQFENKKLNTLEATETEVLSIETLFKGKTLPAQICVHQAANESIIKSPLLKKYQYLHFATHGVVDEQNPELSQIFLAHDEKEDGNLYSGEIYNLDIEADLVTLSACETGLGKITKGEGIIGLSRALLYAGANNLQVTLWTVADQSTANYMIDFYRNLLQRSSDKNIPYSIFLRKAKLKMLQQKKYSKPYYWAPFILIGK